MTNELIKITENEQGKKITSARELHEFLQVKQDFSDWIKKQLELVDAIENVDYSRFLFKREGNNATISDYSITIDISKEICMITGIAPRCNEETKKLSKEARQYFIACEKQLKEISTKALLLEKIYNGGQDGILASKQLAEIEVKEATKELNQKIEEDKPLVEFGNQVLKSADNILVRELSKLAFEQGIDIGEKKLYKKLREWKYIMQGSTEPYQSAMNQGLFVVEEKSINTPYGVKLTKTTKVSPKGQVFIIEKLRKEMVSK